MPWIKNAKWLALAVAAVFLNVSKAELPPAKSASCVAPASVYERVRTHPGEDSITAVGTWFGDHQKMKCAIDTFRAGVRADPNSARLNYLLGLSLYSAGRYEDSLVPLREAVRIQPKDLKTCLLLGNAYTRLERGKEALRTWQDALTLDPGSNMALDGMAKLLNDAGEYSTVIAHLSAAARDDVLDLDLAIAYAKAGAYDEAANVLNESLVKHPDSQQLTRTLVTVYVHQLRYHEACQLAAKLALRNPKDLEAQRIYLRVLVLDGDNEAAAPLGARLLANAPHDADLLYLNGVLERAAGDYAAARRHLEEAAAFNPRHYNTHYNLGAVLEQQQDATGAEREFQQAIDLGAREPEVLFELAKVKRKLGKDAEAIEELKLYQARLKEKSDSTLAAQKATQAAEALKAGDKAGAAGLYKEASAALPADASIAYQLAMVLNDLDDLAAEREALERAVRSDPAFALAQYQLGYVDSRQGDPISAEQRFRAALKSVPQYVQAWVALSAALAMQSRFDEANSAVTAALQIDPVNDNALSLKKSLPPPGEQPSVHAKGPQ